MSDMTVRNINLVRRVAPCSRCGKMSKRHSMGQRNLYEVGIDGPVMLKVEYSKHRCPNCQRIFSSPMDSLAKPRSRFTNRVRQRALHYITCDSLTLRETSEKMMAEAHVRIPITTLHDWRVDENCLCK